MHFRCIGSLHLYLHASTRANFFPNEYLPTRSSFYHVDSAIQYVHADTKSACSVVTSISVLRSFKRDANMQLPSQDKEALGGTTSANYPCRG